MPVSRMKMRPWLEIKINSNCFSGLVWVDKKEKIFAIPWKHAARHGWEVEKDACLFKAWAIHTGKYTEGQSNADPKTWKANFRCAMNSLNDIEEVKDKSINKGHQAVRVYRMLHVTSKPKDKRSKAKDATRRKKSSRMKEEEMDYSDVQSSEEPLTELKEETYTTQENTVDSTEQPEALQMSPFDVPEWSTSVEIGPDSTSDLYKRFQVSPEHTPDCNYEITKIKEELELESSWMPINTHNMGFLTSETYTDSSSQSESPASQWSDTSSAQEDDIALYTELIPSFTTPISGNWLDPFTDPIWNIHNSCIPTIPC